MEVALEEMLKLAVTVSPSCVLPPRLVTVVVTPLVLGLNYGVAWLLKASLNFDAHEHPLAKAGQQGLLPIEWALLAFAVMIAAPAREELLFRGILQRLFGQSGWGAHVGMGLAFLFVPINTAAYSGLPR